MGINYDRGHTLVELLIALVVALTTLAAVYSVYAAQQRLHQNQQLMLKARQNACSALTIAEQQIRMAGYDPQDSGVFGVTDVRRHDLIGTHPNPAGQPALTFTRDLNENGSFDGGGERVRFCIRQDGRSGKRYLAWDMGSGRFPVAENIEALGFAFAVDRNHDGRPDACPGTAHLIWAVDSDNDNRLDTNLDANCDGRIGLEDDQDGDKRITAADGAALTPPVDLDRILAVRVWLLTVTDKRLRGAGADMPQVLGDRIVEAQDDGRHRGVFETTVLCRNF